MSAGTMVTGQSGNIFQTEENSGQYVLVNAFAGGDAQPAFTPLGELFEGVSGGGQQQQLAIARALLTDLKILILDEPTEGIQPNSIGLIGETLLKIKKEGRLSILLVEQYLDFCLNVGDSFYIMDRGAIVAEGPIAHLNDDIVKQHLTV